MERRLTRLKIEFWENLGVQALELEIYADTVRWSHFFTDDVTPLNRRRHHLVSHAGDHAAIIDETVEKVGGLTHLDRMIWKLTDPLTPRSGLFEYHFKGSFPDHFRNLGNFQPDQTPAKIGGWTDALLGIVMGEEPWEIARTGRSRVTPGVW